MMEIDKVGVGFVEVDMVVVDLVEIDVVEEDEQIKGHICFDTYHRLDFSRQS